MQSSSGWAREVKTRCIGHSAKNGIAMLTLGRDSIVEAACDMGSTKPVWTP